MSIVPVSTKADRERISNIVRQRVLQNLLVIPGTKGKKEVAAGGWRLGRLQSNCLSTVGAVSSALEY